MCIRDSRSTDIHGLLYYSKNPEELHLEFIDTCLGCRPPISFKAQKEVFQEILSDTLGEECGYELAKQLHENLAELAEEHKEDMEPLRPVSYTHLDVYKRQEPEGVKQLFFLLRKL